MFYKEFALLVVIATMITIPFSWYLLQRWLDSFVYSINILPEPFITSAALSLAVALITVSFHVYKSATLNPVNALRSE